MKQMRWGSGFERRKETGASLRTLPVPQLRRLEYVETFFRRHGKLLILGARFLDGLRQLNGIVAGMAWMPWGQFLFYTSLGASFWVGFWGVLSYRLGEGVAHVGDVIIKVELWLLAGLAIVLLAPAIFLLLRRQGARTDCS